MQIPDGFRNAIKTVFMDKTVGLRKQVEKTGELGSVTKAPALTYSGQYQCNVQTIADAINAQEWGLTIGQDAKLSASDPIPCERGDYLDYNEKVYRIEGILDRDSHQELILKLLPSEVVLSE